MPYIIYLVNMLIIPIGYLEYVYFYSGLSVNISLEDVIICRMDGLAWMELGLLQVCK